MNLILASASPRRHELLKMIVNDFKIKASNFDERSVLFSGNASEYVMELAKNKALEIFTEKRGYTVIGMDTVVFINDTILNKPKDRQEAKEMMNIMKGKSHEVLTGFAIFLENSNEVRLGYEKTLVTFDDIDDIEIEKYLDTKDYEGKAGGYAIQGEAAKFIQKIEGDFFNVVGLPVSRIYRELKKLSLL